MSPTRIRSLTRDEEDLVKWEIQPHEKVESTWQFEYKTAINNLEDLCDKLALDIKKLPVDRSHPQTFPLRVPLAYVNRMQKSNPCDPLLLQVLPHNLENQHVAGFSKDPVGDLNCVKTAGLLQKYQGRALLLVTSRCAIHCRYCFRRHFPYTEHNPRQKRWARALEILKNDCSISEVILSGGDPLVLSDQHLEKLVSKLETIDHIKILRIHTRLPVVIPSRICKPLLAWMHSTRLKLVMVLHINHEREINQDLQERLGMLSKQHCTLLNQSVLLRNVNADAESLIHLSKKAFSANILPYYLHLLDKVAGAAHFYVPENEACSLMREVSSHLPGYLVPKLVKEVAGKPAKCMINY